MNKNNLFQCCVYIFCLLLCISCHSLVEINGTTQGLSGYLNKTIEADPTLVQDPAKPICCLEYEEAKVYKITGDHIKKCLENNSWTLLYVWDPLCSGKTCVPPEIAEYYSGLYKVDVFIIAEYYDAGEMKKVYNIESPIFGVDCTYYNSNYKTTYLKRFFKDIDNEFTFKEKKGSILLFEGTEFVKQVSLFHELEI